MQNKLEQAIEIALASHRGQTDKAGAPYILHPLRLMLQMAAEEEMIVAVLHDAVEDGGPTIDDLRAKGFSQEILDAMVCITKLEGERYDEYIQRIKINPLASRVKIADLQDNMNLHRLISPQQQDLDRVEKYKKALDILQSRISS
jgi:(p)ppGpp synthase/HD superfamily hydrolase